MIGAGGGGCGNGANGTSYSGCSGAGGGAITGTLRLTPGMYTITVGDGGKGVGGGDWQGGAGGTGGSTTLSDSNGNIIASCTGGTGGRAWFRGHWQTGVGGSSVYNSNFLTNVTQYPGSNGTGGNGNNVVYTCQQTISGNTNGVGGAGMGSSSGYTYLGEDGTSGYFKVEWI